MITARNLRFTIQPCLFIVLTLLVRGSGYAELTLNSLFTDHAVLQQSKPVPVWGTTDAGRKVTVTLSGQTREAKADESGKWMVKLDPLTASATGSEMVVISGDDKITVKDILIGEVWVCSGQSNMAMSVSGTLDAEKMATEAATDAFKGIRLFKAPVAGEDERQTSVKAQWTLPDAATVARFSATGFYFGRALNRDKNVPVGLIQSANGGTNAYSWINSDTLKNDEVAQTVRDYWKAAMEKAPAAMANYEKQRAKWAAADKATRPARAPREPMHPGHVKRPSGHYNAMIAPLQPYAIRGAIWYQGEANSRVPFVTQYRDLMFALVEDWRSDWHAAAGGEGEPAKFPFYMVQLPNFEPGAAWAVIREQMLKFWQDGENTGTVVTIDVGDAKDIHPKNKLPVGERLARFARADTYGDDIVYSGPIYDSMTVEGNKITLKFKHTGGGLKSRDDKPLTNFEVGDAQGNFAPATAEIVGDSVVVTASDIAEPRAVRYAWSPNPQGINFVNGEDLPASPFRTDSWDLLTE